MTTEVAFRIMINTRGIHKILHVRRGTVGKWRHDLKNEAKISLDKKTELLERAGYVIHQDTRWLLPGAVVPTKEIDYLNEFPSLTLVGRIAGMNDDQIRKINEAFIKNPQQLLRVYRQMA